MKLKEETKIALAMVSLIYVVFTAVKTAFFFDHSLEWHLITSASAIVFIGFFGYIVRAIDIYLDKIYPFEKNPIIRITIQFLITISVLFAIRTIPYLLFYNLIPYHPPREMLIATYAINVFMVLSVILSIFGYHFFVRWRQEKIAAAELEKEKALVQYDNLKNQLNPHFLFNALSSLNSLIFENPELASDFLQQLSKVYRYVLDNKDKNAVPLQTEIDFVSHYIKLLETRFGSGIQVTFNIADSAKEALIVPVTLQILVENAVKHNTTTKDSPLVIDVKSEGNYLTVTNNLQKRSVIETSNGQGLENLRTLYKYIFPDAVTTHETTHSFEVKIPLT
jgi:two-component system LytT family sensor kinase